MSYYFKNIRPGLESDGEDELLDLLKAKHKDEDLSSDDEMKTLSFGSLQKAEALLNEEDKRSHDVLNKNLKIQKNKLEYISKLNHDSEYEESHTKSFKEDEFEDSSNESFFEESFDKTKKKNKHAPKEVSAKKPVAKLREIPGLDIRKDTLYDDIRFDKSIGKSKNLEKIRQNYKFLDEYRRQEINELSILLKDRKFLSKISDQEQLEINNKLKSMQSKLHTIKSKDLERNIIKDYESEINKGNKNKYYLKKSEKRKVIQKWKFDNLKSKQLEKIMERKRKKRLGKEFRQFEFHKK